MNGINRYDLDESYLEGRNNYGIKCVFLSHQKADSNACRKIADYLINAGIDVYFDEYDRDLKSYLQTKNPKGVVNAIKKGINKSSHILCVVSTNTLNSKWVPWEIGYGYDKKVLSVLCLKGIPKGQLPDYLKCVPIVRDIYDLNNYIPKILESTTELLVEKSIISNYNEINNPLSSVMDSLIYETL